MTFLQFITSGIVRQTIYASDSSDKIFCQGIIRWLTIEFKNRDPYQRPLVSMIPVTSRHVSLSETAQFQPSENPNWCSGFPYRKVRFNGTAGYY